jgi:hypothetical protein
LSLKPAVFGDMPANLHNTTKDTKKSRLGQ